MLCKSHIFLERGVKYVSFLSLALILQKKSMKTICDCQNFFAIHGTIENVVHFIEPCLQVIWQCELFACKICDWLAQKILPEWPQWKCQELIPEMLQGVIACITSGFEKQKINRGQYLLVDCVELSCFVSFSCLLLICQYTFHFYVTSCRAYLRQLLTHGRTLFLNPSTSSIVLLFQLSSPHQVMSTSTL
jgi:hypothetical protein